MTVKYKKQKFITHKKPEDGALASREKQIQESMRYPVIVWEKKQLSLPQRAFVFGFLCSVVTSVIHLFLMASTVFSLIMTAAGSLTGFSILFLSISRWKGNQGFYTLLSGAAVCLLEAFADQIWMKGQWTASLILPINTGITQLLVILITVVHRRDFDQYCIYLFIASLLGLASFTASVVISADHWMLAGIPAVLSAGTLVIIFSVFRKTMVCELTRRMHV